MFETLLYSYVFSLILLCINAYGYRVKGQDDWFIMVVFGLIPVINWIGAVIYLWQVIVLREPEGIEPFIEMKQDMNKIAECKSCEILSYVGRIKQNNDKCPFCDGEDIDYCMIYNNFENENVYSEKYKEAPLSIKLTLKESFDIHKKIFKEKQLQNRKDNAKLKKKEEIKQIQEEVKKVEFKDSQLEKYLKLQEKKLENMIGEKNNEKRDNIS